MSTRKIVFSDGEYYHVYNRGNSKQKIFHDKEDYQRFISLLYACNQSSGFKSDSLKKNQDLFSIERDDQVVSLGAYCLMPNHFHLLVRQIEGGSVSQFAQKLGTSYVMYYNKKYQRTGSLFEGKFKAEHLETDRYLKYMYSYIHLNPMKLIDKNWKSDVFVASAKSWNFLNDYSYSSFYDYASTDKRKQVKILNKKDMPSYFPDAHSFRRELKEWFHYYNETDDKTLR